MNDKFAPSDREHRSRIENELDTTFFIEAGAGTGKTTELVRRIANLVMLGKTEIDRIAAITFTEAAAAELRYKVRSELDKHANDQELTEEERRRCRAAAFGLDNASIQTLHSFAASLLREKPIEAGLPPNFKVVADIEENIDFEEHWRAWQDSAMETMEIATHMFTAMTMGLSRNGLKEVARSLHDNYDRLPEHFQPVEVPTRRAVSALIAQLDSIRNLILLARDGLNDPLAQHGQRVLALGEMLAPTDPFGDTALLALSNFGKLSFRRGSQKNWETNPATGMNACTELKSILDELEELRLDEVQGVRRAALMHLLESLRSFIIRYVEERRNSGKAQFHDLLVWARDMLRDNPHVREHFQEHFTHILIDEFQDTDPIQAEIAFFLAADRAAMGNAAKTELDWRKLRIAPGKLFVVGDPKQSIYRFRRADIATVQDVSDLLGAGRVPLEQNFRSQEPVIRWVNSIFRKWMGTGKHRVQAAYSDLTARWDTRYGEPLHGVHKFGTATDYAAAQIRKYEAAAIVNVLRRIKTSKWKIRADDKGGLRDAGFKDICILMPTRNILPSLERALDEANIPYRVESESFVLGTQDVRELLNCLRSIDSPADQVALVAALRSTAFGCSDTELVEFLDNGGHLDYTDPGSGDGPVREALKVLADYNKDRGWMPMDKLIEKFIRDRCMEEVSFLRPRPRERLRRLKLVVEQACAFAQVGENSLRVFADWMEQQAQEGARLVEIPVPEMDEDAVRIMTIHAAKGLEFPIVLLAGIGSSGSSRSSNVIFDREDNSVHVRVGTKNKQFTTPGYEAAKEMEKEADEAEAIRLMYVATTRAKDHLMLSLFSKATSRESKALAAAIERLAGETGCSWHDVDCTPAEVAPVPENKKDGDKAQDTEADREQWMKARASVIQQASKKPAVAVTEIARFAKDEAEGGEVYYRTGRGGTSLGRAVHSVLQSIDLATGEGLEEMSKAQAAGEGIHDKWQEVAKLVQSGLDSEVVKRAVASGRYYREVFVGAPLEKRLVEGFIDLLFEEDGSLVIADYKTDALDNEEEEMKREKQYSLQAGTYAFTVEQVTGRHVKEVVLVFLRSAREISKVNIDSLTFETRQRIISIFNDNGG